MKLFLKYIFLLCITGYGITLSAQNNSRVQIFCNDCQGKKRILVNEYADSLKIQQILNSKISELHLKGYIAAAYDSIVVKDELYSAYLSQGKKYVWKMLSITGVDEDELKKDRISLDRLRNKPFDHNKFIRTLDEILVFYENNGYPFASIELTELNDDDGLTAEVKLKKNELYFIDSIYFKGPAGISPNFFSNYTDIKKGDIYNESLIRDLRKRLEELLFLNERRSFEVRFRENKVDIFTYLEDKKANQFNGIIGFLPNNQTTNQLLLTGEANLFLINSFNQGESITFNWQKLESSSQDLDLKFDYPFLFKFPVGVNFELNFVKRDTTFLTVETQYGTGFKLRGKNYIKAFYKREGSSLISTYGFENLTALPQVIDYSSDILGLSFYSDNLDYFYNPQKGYKIDFMIGAGEKVIRKNSAIADELYSNLEMRSTKTEVRCWFEYYIPILKNTTFKFRNISAKKFNDNLFFNELYKFGGIRSIRGFDEESLFASGYSVFTGELRYLFEKNSAFYGFYDMCVLEKEILGEKEEDTPIAVGVGADFETRAGIFSLNYALGKQLGNPFIFRNAKIHFGYINRF